MQILDKISKENISDSFALSMTKFFRFINEVPTILLIFIVFIVIFKLFPYFFTNFIGGLNKWPFYTYP